MKQIITKSVQVLFLTLVVVLFTGCLKNDDLLTDGVRTGGLLTVSGNIPYKLGYGTPVEIEISTGKGAAISQILVYKQFFHAADTTESTRILFATVNVDGANASAEYTHTLSLVWADLIQGMSTPTYDLPADEMLSDIGDSFQFTYESVMQKDDMPIINMATTNVAVANFFAGAYSVHRIYYHPAYPTYPTNSYTDATIDMDFVAVNPTTCKKFFGAWEDNYVFVTIDASDNVTLTFDRVAFVGDPIDPTKLCSYTPATGVIQLYYYYNGAAGADLVNPVSRIFWETCTPK